jgi:hypothetical protein
MELFVDASPLSSAARFIATKAPSTKVIEVTEDIRKSEAFQKASPKGEVMHYTNKL